MNLSSFADPILLASAADRALLGSLVARSALMWVVVGLPFFASGWTIAKIASSQPLLPVLTFALSVSTTILIALILERGQGNSLDLRMWLTVPLFLVAPATAILAGGLLAIVVEDNTGRII